MTCKAGRVSNTQFIIGCEPDVSQPVSENEIALTNCSVRRRGQLDRNVKGQYRWQVDGIPCSELYDGGGQAYGVHMDDVISRIVLVQTIAVLEVHE